jgi:DNA-binding Xre family transcriptional regulator
MNFTIGRKPPPKPLCHRCGQPKGPGRGKRFCDACHAAYVGQVRRRRCRVCGGPRAPQKQLCDECRQSAKWRHNRLGVIKRRQPCEGCGGPKGPGARRRYCDRCREKRAAPRMCERCGIEPPRYARAKLCLLCHARAKARNRHHHNHLNREARARGSVYPSDRARRAKAAEAHRLADRMRRERQGRPRPPVDAALYAVRYGKGYGRVAVVPAAPLLPFVVYALAHETEAELAERTGISPKRIQDMLNGAPNIALVTADKLCVALGYTLSLVYPEAA